MWTITLLTPPALAVVGFVELVGGIFDIVAPKRSMPELSPAEAAVLPLIGAMRLAMAAFILIVVFLRTGTHAVEMIATAVTAYECVVQPLALARTGSRFRSRMWLALALGVVTLCGLWRDAVLGGVAPASALLDSPALIAANLFVLFGFIACVLAPAAAAKIGLGESTLNTPYFSMDEHHKLSPVAKRLLT